MSVLRKKPPVSGNRIHKMGSALREDGVVATPDDWETYLLHQTEIVGELVKQLGDFADSNSAVLLGGQTMEENIVPGSGTYMVSGRPKTKISLKEAYSAAGKTWFGWWLVEHYLPYHVNCPDGCGLGEPTRGR